MKAFLDNFAAVLGAATVALLLLSVSHEYGYFWVIGSHFQTFLTTTDYFSNAVLWLPALFIAIYAYLDWDVMLGLRRYALPGCNWNGVVWAFIVIVLPIIAFFFFPYPSPFTFILPLVIVWLMYGARLLPFADTDAELLLQVRRVLTILPVVMAVAFGWGISQGINDLRSFGEPYTLQTKASPNQHRILLRTFDKGILARDVAESRIEFIQWDELLKLYRFAPPPRAVPLSCSWFGLNCHNAPTI